MNRNFQGVWIPAAIWLDRDLSMMEKVFAVEIASLETEDRGCYASNAYFAEFFDVTPSRVSQIINGMVDKCLLRAKYVYGGKGIKERRLWTDGYLENLLRPSKEIKQGYLENAEGSNTKSSNTKSRKESCSSLENKEQSEDLHVVKSVQLPPVYQIPLNTGGEFPITVYQHSEFVDAYPAVDVMQELRNMRAWSIANPAKRKTRSGMLRFVNTWLSKAQNSGMPSAQVNGHGQEISAAASRPMA